MGDFGPIATWFVVFTTSAAPQWYQRLLRPGFQHVEAYGWDDRARRWVVVSPNFDVSIVRTIDDAEFGRVLALARGRDGRVLCVQTLMRGPRGPRLFATCCTAVEAVVGAPGPCAVRPWALYRKLLALGAREV
jgi:hypothetical protein